MTRLSFPSTGRLLMVINRTNHILGVAGTTIEAFGTKAISLRKIQGHPTNMSQLETLIQQGSISAAVTNDIISANDAKQLDAPLSGEIWLSRQIWTDPPAADVAAFKTSFSAPIADTVYAAVDFDGVVGDDDLDYARNITFTGTTGGIEALDAKVAVLTGIDIDGQPIRENLPLSALGGGSVVTDIGIHSFRRLTNVLIPADTNGSPGAYEIGFGDKMGLDRPLMQGGILKEFTDNAAPAAPAAVVFAPTALPNGTVVFDAAPDGAKDFIVYYIAG